MHPEIRDPELNQVLFFCFDEFKLDITEEVLSRNGETLNLSHRMFQVLLLLIQRQGEIVDKQEFFEKVWEGSFVEDNNLTVTITALRKVLGDDAKQSKFIRNIPRKGYRFVANATAVYRSAKSELRDQASSESRGDHSKNGSTFSQTQLPAFQSLKVFRHGRAVRLSIAFVAIAILGILTLAVVRQKTSWLLTGHAASRINSIAVLPFENLTSEREYVVDGLSDGLIADLSRAPNLRVIDRASTYQYKARMGDPASVGRELKVDAVVSGTFQQDGDLLLITVDLLDIESDTRVWRQQYRRRVSEIFETQREISNAILQNVQLDRPASTLARSAKRPTEDPEAYDLYLKARYYWNKRTVDDIQRSVQLFKSAIDLDPTFAQAYVGLGNAYTLGSFAGISDDERVQLSRGAIQRALEIDDSLGEAYSALAINKCYHDWDLPGAESDYRRAIELNPNDATAHHWYAELLAMQGRFDESFAEYDRALSLDPLSLPIRSDRALTYYYIRDFDTAIAELKKVRDLNADYERTFEFLQWAYRENGMFKEAADSIEANINLQSRHGERSTADHERFKKFANDLRKASADDGSAGFWKVQLETKMDPSPYSTAVAYAKLGNADKAFEYLEKALDGHYSGMVWLKVTPELDSLRSDPRFDIMMHQVRF